MITTILLFDSLPTLTDDHTDNIARYLDDESNTVVVSWLVLLSLQQAIVVLDNLTQ